MKVMDILAAYDCFQYNHKVKPDYCNIGGLQQYDEDTGEWEDWLYDDGESFYESDRLDEYCEEKLIEQTSWKKTESVCLSKYILTTSHWMTFHSLM